MLHIGFPKDVWHELHDAGRIDYHPVFPGKPGFGSRALATDDDVEDAIALIRLNYERAVAAPRRADHASRLSRHTRSDALLPRRLRGARRVAHVLEAELRRHAAARHVGAVVVDLDVVDPRFGERRAQSCRATSVARPRRMCAGWIQ